MNIKPGKKFYLENGRCVITELFNQQDSNLDYLSAAQVDIFEGGRSPQLSFKYEETLIYNLGDDCSIQVEGEMFKLEHYDVLYVPVNSAFRISAEGEKDAHLYLYRAVGDEVHPVYHAKWKKVKKDKKRIRRLHRKDVYLMFDVSEPANKLISGYTFYQDYTRAWPPHNHTDQEEVYSFIEGRGAMEVYETDEQKTFVTSVETGDHITIPVMNYHPVFSHEEALTFIWTIAGERYWVGDKNKDFMKGTGDKITT
ncbi:MAG: 5-deoxy-glucuronate isomerase [Sediminispirochaetaceae bacterium]